MYKQNQNIAVYVDVYADKCIYKFIVNGAMLKAEENCEYDAYVALGKPSICIRDFRAGAVDRNITGSEATEFLGW